MYLYHFSGVMLSYQYPVYWSVNKAKNLVMATIVTCFVISIAITITCFLINKEGRYYIPTTYHIYIPTCLDILFYILAVSLSFMYLINMMVYVTYTIIFIKYRTARHDSAWKAILNSGAFNSSVLASLTGRDLG